MPTLNWIGKDAVVDHHRKVPTRLLECDPKLSFGDPNAENLLVEGDNLEALKALLPRYRGQVKCIYIDPPYNTGNENWVYNDSVNDPRIRKWLGKYVGKEAEDLCRHDKWLCMMYPRLALLREFLRDDGVVFISINDIESSRLELICREIFGSDNLLARMIWNTEGNTDNQLEIKVNHEYVLVFLKDMSSKSDAIGRVIDPNTPEESNLRKGVADNNINKNGVGNPPSIFTIPIGFPCAEQNLFYKGKVVDDDFFRLTESDRLISDEVKTKYGIENQSGLPVKLDDLVVSDHRVQKPCRVYGGFANRRKLKEFVSNGFKPIEDAGGPIRFYLNRNAAIRYRRDSRVPRNILSVLRGFGTTERTRTELREMRVIFDYPKPVGLVQYLLSFGAEAPDSIVMDCFAGSGSTGHAVLETNKKDGGSRSCVLMELSSEIARKVTRKRLANICDGYTSTKKAVFEGLGSGFRYCKLGRTLLDEYGDINGDVPFPDLARYVFLLETGVPVPKRPRKDCPLLGVHRSSAVYLLYNGVLGDRRPAGGNVLTHKVLGELPPHPDGDDSPRVIFGESTLLSDKTLTGLNVTFRQIPYELRDS